MKKLKTYVQVKINSPISFYCNQAKYSTKEKKLDSLDKVSPLTNRLMLVEVIPILKFLNLIAHSINLLHLPYRILTIKEMKSNSQVVNQDLRIPKRIKFIKIIHKCKAVLIKEFHLMMPKASFLTKQSTVSLM